MNISKYNVFSLNGCGNAARIGCVNRKSSFRTQPTDEKRNEHRNRSRSTKITGVILAEVIMVLFIVAMFTMMAMVNLSGALGRDSFKSRAYDFVKLFQMAATSAAETGRRYEIIVDFVQNTYTLRQITTGLVAVEDILEEEIIQTGQFSDKFQLSYVIFDDGDWTNEAPALFRAGKSGWQYGGKIVVTDENGKEYSILINRLSRMIDIVENDVEIIMPMPSDEMGF